MIEKWEKQHIYSNYTVPVNHSLVYPTYPVLHLMWLINVFIAVIIVYIPQGKKDLISFIPLCIPSA